MEYAFVVDEDGLVKVMLDDDLSQFSHALEDSIGTRPPRGARQDGPSTYWIDRTIAGLRERIESGSLEPFAGGNITYLQLRCGQVEARLDVDDPDSELFDAVPAADLLELLAAWRERVLVEDPGATLRTPPPHRTWAS